MMAEKAPIFAFDDVRVEPCAFRAWKNGNAVPLEPKTFQVLLFLIEHRGRLIEKNELLNSIWKDVFVTENAMTREIAKLRKALGDDPKEPHYIQTVHTRGYRFIGDVREVCNGTEEAPAPERATMYLANEQEKKQSLALRNTHALTDSRVGVEEEAATLFAKGPISTTAITSRGEARVNLVTQADERGQNSSASAAATVAVVPAGRTASVEYLAGEIERYKTLAVATLLVLLVGAIGLIFFLINRNKTNSSTSGRNSIVVMPFVNETGDGDMEYLSDEMAETLIRNLSQLPGLKVTARISSFKYKGKEIDPREVARSLGVEAILTGRVFRRGDSLLISVELINARDSTHVWGEQYNPKNSDLLAVQAEISHEIAQALQLRLTPGEQRQLAKRETVHPQAFELFLRGRFYWNKGTTEDNKKAIDYFNQAIGFDPTYALAYAELFRTYNNLINANVLDPKEFVPKAEVAAYKALELDDTLAEAHVAISLVKRNAWDWAAAEREIVRAIELNPNLAWAHLDYTNYLIIRGRYDQALAEARRARELDPLSTDANSVVVYGLLLAGQNDQAIKAAKKMLELDQTKPEVHTLLGQIYTRVGQHQEAVAAYQRATKLGDNSPDIQIYLGEAYARAGEPEKARVILKRLEKGKEFVSPVALAMLHVALGEREQAFALLERAYAAHDQQLIWLAVDGRGDFAPLRSDTRFQALVRRVGL
jgi:TolB-like protein/DNA-binding winged helix-turn-helix (wHTH) protein/Tfp pilus assembly protein PilF